MLLFWRIRYLDRTDRRFKNRDLFLDTSTLAPAIRAAVEMLIKANDWQSEREILRFRALFIDESKTRAVDDLFETANDVSHFTLSEYFEDEDGQEICWKEIGPILTGNPDAVLVPSGMRQHDLDLMFAESLPIPIAEVALSNEQVRLLGYFARDLQELLDSSLIKEGPGTISMGGKEPPLPNGDYHHQTAVSDDEIRSFVTIFRRLYMAKEPANFVKAVELFASSVGEHPLGNWIKGEADEYQKHLFGGPELRPFVQGTSVSFKVKRLIDVFLYTQFMHQPDEKRQQQFAICLQEVGDRRNFLTYLFLREIWMCGLKLGNAGRLICGWFKLYCDHHSVTPDVLNSLRSEHIGLGIAEKKEARRARLLNERIDELETELWRQAGAPEGGSAQFRLLAQEQLKRALEGDM